MKTLIAICLLFALWFSASQPTIAQGMSQTLRGAIIDNITEAPLPGATVQVLNGSNQMVASTDGNGQFEIKNVPVGRQALEIRFLGYNTRVVQNLLLEIGKETNITIRLDETAFEMATVTVVADKKKAATQNEMVMVSGRTFSKEETERFAGSMGDPARMVANYAGVVAGNDARNDIIIRGNSPAGLLWRIEGVEVPNPNHFGSTASTGGPVSMINNNLLANSDFLTGAFPAEYGNAIGGAFDLNLRSGNSQKHEYVAQMGFSGLELGAEGPLFTTNSGQKASFIINGRYSTLEIANKLGVDFGTGAAVPEYKDLTCMIDIPGTKLGRFKLFTIMGNSHITFGDNFDLTSDNAYNSRGTYLEDAANVVITGITHNIMLSSQSRLKTTVSYQTTGSDARLDSLNYSNKSFMPWIRSYQKEQKVSFSTQWKSKINARNNVSIGTIADMMYTNYLDSIKPPFYNHFIHGADEKGEMFLIRGYAEWQHIFSDKATGYVGLNTQYLHYNNEAVVEPRLGFQYKTTPNQSFNIGFGLHSQIQPRLIYYYQEYDSASHTYSESNKNLQMSRSAHFVLGYNYLITPNFRFKAETYYQHLYKIPVKASFPEYSIANSGGDYYSTNQDSLVNTGTGTNYGLELTFEKFLSQGYYFLFTTSLYNSKYKGSDGVERNTAFNGKYVVNILAGYEYKLNDKFTLTFDEKTVFAGGRPKVPFDLDKSYSSGEVTYDWSNAYEKQYKPYFRLDFRIGLKMNSKHISQEWAVDLQNLTNYQSIYNEALDLKKKEVYNIYQNGFFPMVLYRVRF